jgi:hypothetical protein
MPERILQWTFAIDQRDHSPTLLQTLTVPRELHGEGSRTWEVIVAANALHDSGEP